MWSPWENVINRQCPQSDPRGSLYRSSCVEEEERGGGDLAKETEEGPVRNKGRRGPKKPGEADVPLKRLPTPGSAGQLCWMLLLRARLRTEVCHLDLPHLEVTGDLEERFQLSGPDRHQIGMS